MHFLPDFAERFQAAGFGVLTYDNRCWGDSEGTPREEVDPWLQTRDYFDVFNFATSLPEVDSTKVFYWGSSMSGGNAICAAAINKSIAGVILHVPFVSGEAISRTPGMSTAPIIQERGHATVSGSGASVPIFPTSVEDITNPLSKVVLKDHDALPFIDEMKRRNMQWGEATRVQSLMNTLLHEPRAYIHRISPTPLLMVVADGDVTTQTHLQLDAFDKALEPKKLVLLKGAGHFTPYFGDLFEKNVKAQIEFLKEVTA
jgi:pimeloyl-ACP methyl ester carboxylesterase